MIRILFVATNPVTAVRIRVDQEGRAIQENLQLGKMRACFELHIRMEVRSEDLSQALLDIGPNIVHFAGHGSQSGGVYLEGKEGNPLPVGAETLAAFFKLFSDQVGCVLLNACYTEAHAMAIVKHIQYVIGVAQTISDEAAIAFTVGFYQALVTGKSIEQAYELGVAQIQLQGILEYPALILFKKG